MARARPASRRLLVLAATVVAAAVAVTVAATAEEDELEGGAFEFNLPGHGKVKATWSVADEEESRLLDRMAAEKKRSSSSSSSSSGAGDGIPFGVNKFSRDAYEYVADLLRQGRGEQPSHGKGEKPRAYWKEVHEKWSRMLDRVATVDARRRTKGDSHRAAATHAAGDEFSSFGRFAHTIFSGKSNQNGHGQSHVKSDKEFTKLPPHDDM